jgi:hypothetical protein
MECKIEIKIIGKSDVAALFNTKTNKGHFTICGQDWALNLVGTEDDLRSFFEECLATLKELTELHTSKDTSSSLILS